jgi:hypothetical protein
VGEHGRAPLGGVYKELQVSRRKDRERFLRLKQQDPNYAGFRGANTETAPVPVPLESVTCSVCQRKRNVPVDTIPNDPRSFVCIRCQEQQAPSV